MSGSLLDPLHRRSAMRSARVRAIGLDAPLPVALLALVLIGCDALPSPPGKPVEADRYVAPNDVVDFEALYSMHCSGCHGANGTLGPARALHDPLYLALVPRRALERTIRTGVPGTPMPAFGQDEGGPLTEAQLDALIDGLIQRWGGEAPGGLPAYTAAAPGDADRGLAAFDTFCADCHGADGRGAKRAGSVVDPSYLGLVSDQGLRTSVIVGRPDLDMPDYRRYVSSRVMSDREIDDVVAWLVAQRPRYPGQPYPSTDDARPPQAMNAELPNEPAAPGERGTAAESFRGRSAPRQARSREAAQGVGLGHEQEESS
jgi:mono/diheme cytochrome c family protein